LSRIPTQIVRLHRPTRLHYVEVRTCAQVLGRARGHQHDNLSALEADASKAHKFEFDGSN